MKKLTARRTAKCSSSFLSISSLWLIRSLATSIFDYLRKEHVMKKNRKLALFDDLEWFSLTECSCRENFLFLFPSRQPYNIMIFPFLHGFIAIILF